VFESIVYCLDSTQGMTSLNERCSSPDSSASSLGSSRWIEREFVSMMQIKSNTSEVKQLSLSQGNRVMFSAMIVMLTFNMVEAMACCLTRRKKGEWVQVSWVDREQEKIRRRDWDQSRSDKGNELCRRVVCYIECWRWVLSIGCFVEEDRLLRTTNEDERRVEALPYQLAVLSLHGQQRIPLLWWGLFVSCI